MMNKYLNTYFKYRERANFINLKKFELLYISEEKLIKALKNNGDIIEHIDNPSEEEQLLAVENLGTAIYYIFEKGIEPSEEVQLAAVQNDGNAIATIIDNKLIPSEEIQLAAVKQNGEVIQYIVNKRIKPSEDVQLAAVRNIPNSFNYIIEPYPSVIKLYKELTNK